MLRNALTLLSLGALSISVAADECVLDDVANFPNSVCSISSRGVDAQMLRFGRIDDVDEGSENKIIIRSGVSVYVIDEDTEILQEVITTGTTGDVTTCNDVNAEDVGDEIGKEIAFTLDGDSLNAPRKVSKIWILGCEVGQAK